MMSKTEFRTALALATLTILDRAQAAQDAAMDTLRKLSDLRNGKA